MLLKLYLLSQTQNGGYDTYDSCIVAAKSGKDARGMHPSGIVTWPNYGDWVSTPALVTAEYLGMARKGQKRGVICASFNAG